MPTVLKYQWQLFLLAVSFFSRLPVPASLPYSSERMNQAGRYFALVGLLLGTLCAGVFTLLSHLFSPTISVFLTMVVSLLLTGAFHEDGLTDMADGIGGGMTVERRLTIMKDSRIGTYGASALVMALLGKFLFLSTLAEQMSLFSVWQLGYTLSRAVAASLIYACRMCLTLTAANPNLWRTDRAVKSWHCCWLPDSFLVCGLARKFLAERWY